MAPIPAFCVTPTHRHSLPGVRNWIGMDDEQARQRILAAKVEARASGKLADPEDALRFLDMSAFEVSEEGDVDAAKIDAAIGDLLERKPYLKASGAPPGTKPSADGGARGKAAPGINVEETIEGIRRRTGIR
jgi:hypothetical protein